MTCLEANHILRPEQVWPLLRSCDLDLDKNQMYLTCKISDQLVHWELSYRHLPVGRTSEKLVLAVPLSHFCKFNIRISKFRSIENAHFHNMSLVNPFETQLCGGPW